MKRNPNSRLLPLLLATSLFTQACILKPDANDCFKIIPESQSVDQPALVSVGFKVTHCSGDPVGDLQAADFRIKQDGEDISKFEAAAATVSSNKAYVSEILLLIDLSGSVTASGKLTTLKDSAKKFIDSAIPPESVQSRKVAIFSFDGNTEIHKIAALSNDAASLKRAIDSISCPGSYCSDSTTNLYGAVWNAVISMDAQVLQDSQLHRESIYNGSVVVFTDGTDRAQRATRDQAVNAVKRSKTAVFTVGVGAEYDEAVLKQLGKSGYFAATDYTQLGEAFTKVADEIENEANSHYILHLCSDRRNNASHKLEIGVEADGLTGSFTTDFSSSAFTGGCVLPK